jgi:hypothetical protein
MKKVSAAAALIAPDLDGWRVAGKKYPTLAEAVAAVPAKGKLHLALPCQDVLLERLKLPSTDRAELSGMLQLQLEKTLPYPVEEVSSDFQVLGTGENESTLLSVAAHSGQLDDLCAPMRKAERLPEKITLFAMHVAAACPADQVVLVIYAEQGKLVTAIVEGGKLGWAQTFPGLDPETLVGELPQLLLPAELDGVPTNFSCIRLARDLEPLAEPLRNYFELPVEFVSLDDPLPEPAGNLLPPAWEAEEKRNERTERLKQQLLTGAVVWLLAVAGAFLYLAWLKRQEQQLAVELAAAKPDLEYITSREARWNALAPAVDPSRYTVELLYQLHKNLGPAEIKITELDQQLTEWKATGEAPSAAAAIEYVERLKNDKELGAWQITSGPPQILPNEHAQFSIFGKQ